MIVADDGTAYVSQFGYDLFGGTTPLTPTVLIRVTPDGRADAVAHDLMSPNGIALSEDGRTLVVAEPGASRLTRYRVADDGGLVDRTLFAQITPAEGKTAGPPDGICLDAAGAVWMADPVGARVLRVEPGGNVTHDLPFEGHPLAVALGGPDRRTLFVCVVTSYDQEAREHGRGARLDTLTVDVPGSGRP
jgi:sugar lactone lactonase YvrE